MVKNTRSSKNALIRTFYPLVGSISDYQRNIADILSAVQKEKPTRNEAIEWMTLQYKASREFCRKLLDMLKLVGLIATADKRYQLTDNALHYLRTRRPEILAWIFVDKVLGFAELIEVLSQKQTMDKNTLRSEWKARLSVTLPASQFDHRLNWLRGLGYSDLVARNYFLTESGLKLAAEIKQKAAVTVEEKQTLSHRDLENSIKIIGEFFEFETTDRPSINEVLPSYALKLTEGDRQLDCLWVRYIPFAGKIKFPRGLVNRCVNVR